MCKMNFVELVGGEGGRGLHPFFVPDEKALYLANASFHLERGMSSSISIPWNFSFCFLFDLSFSPFFVWLPSSSSLSSSSSVSLSSLCLDLRYSSHLSGWKLPNHHCYKLQIVIFLNLNHPSSFFDLLPASQVFVGSVSQNNFHNTSSLNKEIHDRDGFGYLILITIDAYDFISPFSP